MTSTAPVAASDNDRVIPTLPRPRRSPENPPPKVPGQRSAVRRPGPLTRAVVRDRRLTRQLDAALNTNQPGIVRQLRTERAALWAEYDAQAV